MSFLSNVRTFGLLKVQDEKGSVRLAPLAKPVGNGGTGASGPALVNSSGRARQEGRALSYRKAFKKNQRKSAIGFQAFQFAFKKIFVLYMIFSRKLMKLSSHCA